MELDDKALAFLEKNHSAAMTTLRADGTPHCVRVGVGLVDGKLWSSGTRDRVRTKNLRIDPRCSLFVFDAQWAYMSLDTTVAIIDGPEAARVTVALLVAVGAAESRRPTLMFLAKEAVRLALDGTAVGTACDGCPSIPDLMGRYAAADGRLLVCPICFNIKQLDAAGLVSNAELGGTVPLWEWIGDDGATTFSY